MPRSTHAQWTLIAVFLGLIWLPLAIAVTIPDESVSMTEKRRLAERPVFAWDGLATYPRAFEDYYNDHFGFRSRLIRWYNLIKVRWFGVSNNDAVLVGRDGWLFQSGPQHFNDMRNAWPFSDAELQHWGQVLQQKHDWLHEQGIAYLFVVTPNKHLIYPDFLPAQVKRLSPHGRIDQLVDHLRTHTRVPLVDLRPALRAARVQRDPYHKTDTHWNAFGAYVGYREVMVQLVGAVPGLKALTLSDDWEYRERAGGDLADVLKLGDILVERALEHRDWQPRGARNLEFGEQVDNRIRNKNAFTTVCDTGQGRLLMFRDSFSLAMMPYLSETFHTAYYFPSSPVPLDGMKRVIAEQRPDVVIEQRSSRWLRTPQG